MTEKFTGSFTQQEPIPDEGIVAANAVMRSGRLHRYNTSGDEIAEAALLEEEFAATVGSKYCLAVASGGYAMTTALRASGVGHGDKVRISTRRGTVQATAKLTAKLKENVVFMPFHFADGPANALTNPVLDPIAKIPEFKSCAACVEKC